MNPIENNNNTQTALEGLKNKDFLKNWDINAALGLLWENSKGTVAFSNDLHKVWLEVSTYGLWEHGEDFNAWVDEILSKYLIPKNVTI